LLVSNDEDSAKVVTAVVTGVNAYSSFEELLSQEGLARTLPGTDTIASGVATYRAFYTEEQERRNGVLAIHLRVEKRGKRGCRLSTADTFWRSSSI